MITWLAVIAFLMCFERSDPEIGSCRGLVRATGCGVVGRLGTLTGVVESLPRGATNDFLSQRTASQLGSVALLYVTLYVVGIVRIAYSIVQDVHVHAPLRATA